MPREIIEIPLTDRDPYYSGALFLATLAYPNADESEKRHRFVRAVGRNSIEQKMCDPEFLQEPQQIRPIYFMGTDKEHESVLRAGGKRLHRTLIAAQLIAMPHFLALQTGKLEPVQGFFPNVLNMSILTAAKLKMHGDSAATVKSRIWKPAKAVAHAACAYALWCNFWESKGHDPNEDRYLAFLCTPSFVAEVVDASEQLRQQISSIRQFKIAEADTIQLTAKWIDGVVVSRSELSADVLAQIAAR
jgi:hypothetical protein